MATILVVEDRRIDREYLSTLLGYGGHRVLQASDGAEALITAQKGFPQLIISDVLMPTMDGYEFVRRLRQLDAIAGTPVMFYTATYHEAEARGLARQCGVFDILTKPSEPQTILATVDAVLARGRGPTAPPSPAKASFDYEHAVVINEKLSAKVVELDAAERRLTAVVDFCQLLASEKDPSTVLASLCANVREMTLAKQSVVGLISADGKAVERFLTNGFEAEPASALELPSPAAAVLQPVLTLREVVRCRNAGGEPQTLGLPSSHGKIYSYLAAPIASPSRVYGWLSVRNKLGADEFSAADQEMVVILGAHAGIALENADLIQSLRRHTASLEAAQTRTQFALDAARVGIWELDVTSDRLFWSDALTKIFELAPDEVPQTGRDFIQLVDARDRAMVEQALQTAIRDRTELNVEFTLTARSEKTRWVNGRASVLSQQTGDPIGMFGVAIDITHRRSLEDQLRQAQKLEGVGQLAGGIAHDFNNVLTAILGYSNLVLETIEPEDPRHNDLNEVIEAAQRAAALTRQLLAFSRKQVLQPVALQLNAVVGGTEQMLRRLTRENIEFVTVLGRDLGIVRADPGQIDQILVNLVVNAGDAMPDGGRLVLETSSVSLDESFAEWHGRIRPGRYAMLAVADSGTGMTDEVKRRLFEPFFTTKEPGKGTGLGLATVHGIVQQSAGYLSVSSELGKGSTFRVYLPVVDLPVDAPRSADDTTTTRGSETILLVEDEDGVRLLSRTILERLGYRVLAARDPDDAQLIFAEKATEIDLLVTDVIMPGSTGPSLFARLAERRPALRVLYVSGYSGDAIAHHGHVATTINFLQKPFTAAALGRRVREVLDR